MKTNDDFEKQKQEIEREKLKLEKEKLDFEKLKFENEKKSKPNKKTVNPFLKGLTFISVCVSLISLFFPWGRIEGSAKAKVLEHSSSYSSHFDIAGLDTNIGIAFFVMSIIALVFVFYNNRLNLIIGILKFALLIYFAEYYEWDMNASDEYGDAEFSSSLSLKLQEGFAFALLSSFLVFLFSFTSLISSNKKQTLIFSIISILIIVTVALYVSLTNTSQEELAKDEQEQEIVIEEVDSAASDAFDALDALYYEESYEEEE